MRRSARWLLTWAATAVTFIGCLWLARMFSFSFEPRAESDRWVVAAAFAATMSAAMLAGGSWWASREKAAQVSQLPPEQSATKADQTPTLSSDHVDFRGSTFNAPVTGKGDINIDENRRHT
jgi:hypothetical protein